MAEFGRRDSADDAASDRPRRRDSGSGQGRSGAQRGDKRGYSTGKPRQFDSNRGNAGRPRHNERDGGRSGGYDRQGNQRGNSGRRDFSPRDERGGRSFEGRRGDRPTGDSRGRPAWGHDRDRRGPQAGQKEGGFRQDRRGNSGDDRGYRGDRGYGGDSRRGQTGGERGHRDDRGRRDDRGYRDDRGRGQRGSDQGYRDDRRRGPAGDDRRGGFREERRHPGTRGERRSDGPVDRRRDNRRDDEFPGGSDRRRDNRGPRGPRHDDGHRGGYRDDRRGGYRDDRRSRDDGRSGSWEDRGRRRREDSGSGDRDDRRRADVRDGRQQSGRTVGDRRGPQDAPRKERFEAEGADEAVVRGDVSEQAPAPDEHDSGEKSHSAAWQERREPRREGRVPESKRDAQQRKAAKSNLRLDDEALAKELLDAPELPDDIDFSDLDAEVRQELRTLPRALAETVGKHLVAAGELVDDDPEAALKHARYAKSKAARVPIVREALGLVSYHAGNWAEALSELRAVRRMTRTDSHIAVIADAERALGRPERALDLAKEANARPLPRDVEIELRIVAAGARRDLGQLDAAVVSLQGPDLNPSLREPWSARLFYAYADNLAAVGRRDEAVTWFLHAAEADDNEETDAAERAAELSNA